jgi:hypothetical protein
VEEQDEESEAAAPKKQPASVRLPTAQQIASAEG